MIKLAAKYILALDQGTTSSRAILFDRDSNICAAAQQEFEQYFPYQTWVEHDPEEIWRTQLLVLRKAISQVKGGENEIAAVGITNQRETTIVWDRESGQPVANAIVWQDRRTATFCEKLKQTDGAMIKQKTGLIVDAYFSASKLHWILNHIDGAREKANAGKLAFGSVDSWLIYKLTGGKEHLTDVTNASRTMLYNIHSCQWDQELLEIFDIPASMLPKVVDSSGVFCHTDAAVFGKSVPISGIAGDQHAALFGQMCGLPGMLKNTYGTGCFMMMNTGAQVVDSQNNLLTTIAWSMNGKVNYALEGSVFIAGAVVQWLRDGLGLIKTSKDIEALAKTVKDNGGVYFVPAFTGLGAPYWDSSARGTITGLTRGSTAGHLARAALEAIAFQSADALQAMQADSGILLNELRVDGGASVNDLLMQFQADLMQIPVVRPGIVETTALGGAYLAGLAIGFWDSVEQLEKQWRIDARFDPEMAADEARALSRNWKRAIKCAQNWHE